LCIVNESNERIFLPHHQIAFFFHPLSKSQHNNCEIATAHLLMLPRIATARNLLELLLVLEFLLLSLFSSERNGLGLKGHDTLTPLLAKLLVLGVVLGSHNVHDLGELLTILILNTGQSNSGGSLLANQLTETSLALDEAIRNILLLAKSGQVQNELHKCQNKLQNKLSMMSKKINKNGMNFNAHFWNEQTNKQKNKNK
jgi:hypothetical protein